MSSTIILTQAEQHTLEGLTLHEQSALAFWQHILHHRGYIVTPAVLPMISQQGAAGTYRLEWTSRALGPASIADGRRLGKVGKY